MAAAATSSLSGAGEALPGEAVLLLLSPRDAMGQLLPPDAPPPSWVAAVRGPSQARLETRTNPKPNRSDLLTPTLTLTS